MLQILSIRDGAPEGNASQGAEHGQHHYIKSCHVWQGRNPADAVNEIIGRILELRQMGIFILDDNDPDFCLSGIGYDRDVDTFYFKTEAIR